MRRSLHSHSFTRTGKEHWIGLYKAGTAEGATWSWANHRCGVNSFSNWEPGQPDSRFGHEHCGFMSGSTGLWGDYGCHHAEFRCLCELGAEAPSTYNDSMRSLGDTLERAARMHRMLLAAVIGAAVGLPILLENSDILSYSLQAPPRTRAAAASLKSDAHPIGCSTTAESSVLLHVGWALSFCCWLPFVCHCKCSRALEPNPQHAE